MKRGFTLIELLAVIVLLAIIATIATPIVLNIIEDAKISSIKSSANSYLKSAELFVSNAKLNNIEINYGTYPIMGDGNLCIGAIEENKCIGEIVKIEIKGRKAENGKIIIDEKGTQIDYLEIDGYVYYKENDKYKVQRGQKDSNQSYDGSTKLEDSSVPYLTNYRIYGNEITGVGDYDETTGKYKISVITGSKNLCNASSENSLIYSSYYNNYTINNQTLTTTGNTFVGFVVEVEPSTTYSFKIHQDKYNNEDQIRLYEYSDKPTEFGTTSPFYITKKQIPSGMLTEFAIKNYTVSENTKYVVCAIYMKNIDVNMQFQLEKGSVSTDYVPYIEPQQYIIYLDKPLRCVGEVCDYIDYESEKVIRYIGENIDILSEPIIENIELPKISINAGVSSIDINTSVKPSKFSVNYYK